MSAATSTPDSIENALLQRVKSEFLEMPGLRLTQPQARRLWGLDDQSCTAVLTALLDAQFLFQTRDGAFMRVERTALRANIGRNGECQAVA